MTTRVAGIERARRGRPRRLPLGVVVFLACGLTLAAAIGGSTALTRVIGERIAAEAAERALDLAADAQGASERQGQEMLERSVELIAGDPDLAAYLDAATSASLGFGNDTSAGAASLRDLLAERQRQFGFDLGLLLDPDAHVLARSDQGEAFRDALDRDPLVRAAQTRLASERGYWRFEDGLYQAALSPLTHDGAVVGYLLLAQRLDDAYCRALARGSDAQIALWVTRGGSRSPRLLASSLPPERAGALVASMADGALRDALAKPASPVRVEATIAGQPWLTRLRPIRGRDGAVLGTMGVLASSDVVLAGYRELLRWSLLAGGIALAAALPLSFWLSRRMLAPVRVLASAADAAAAGDFDIEVTIDGRDELARLGRAFERLQSGLREKRDLERFMADVSRHLPEHTHAASRDDIRSASGARTPRTQELVVGGRLGDRYEILALLGRGGMGVVYKVRDLELGDVAALKLLRGSATRDEEQLERLKDEIRLARRITHPNVLRTFDLGEAEGRVFITMEYVRGTTLRALLQHSGRLPYGAGLRVARQTALGLSAAHAAGVLHRDIKPENLILDAGGNARVMDFGIARPTARVGEGLTQAGMVLGSAEYAPPEQLIGGVVDERSDVYACGVVLYELMCGRRPHLGTTPTSIYLAQVQNEAPRPSSLWPGMPSALEEILLRCLAPQQEDRYRNALELARALEGLSA